MHETPELSSAELKAQRDQYAADMYKSCQAIRVFGWSTLPAALGLLVLAFVSSTSALVIIGGTVAGSSLTSIVAGSRWAASCTAERAYYKAIRNAECREWAREFYQ